MKSNSNNRRIQRNSFLIVVLLVTLAFLGLIQGFLLAAFWAAILATIFQRTFRVIRWRLKGRTDLAAFLTVMLIMVIVIIPIILISIGVVNQGQSMVTDTNMDGQTIEAFVEEHLPTAEAWLQERGINTTETLSSIRSTLVDAGQKAANQALQYAGNTVAFLVQFSLMLYLLFFFIRDGHDIMKAIVKVVPLGDRKEWKLINRTALVARSTLKGTVVVACVQGTLGGLLFWFVGIEGALLWGVLMAVLSLLPVGGSAIVWAPAAVILFLQGAITKAIIIVIVGAVLIGLVDNVLRPILVGRDTKMPDYLVLTSTLGGIASFGLSGFVIGPVIAAMFLTVWEMLGQEFGGSAR